MPKIWLLFTRCVNDQDYLFNLTIPSTTVKIAHKAIIVCVSIKFFTTL